MTLADTIRSVPGALVLGLGNALRGDDGVGLAVVDRLGTEVLPEGTRLLNVGTSGLEILLDWAGAARVIVVDAARFGGHPGELRRFDLRTLDIAKTHWGAGHAQGLGAAVALATALQALPDELVLYAIEPEDFEPLHGLSDSVERCIPAVVAAIVAELRSPPAT